jgi:allose kinase
VAEIGGTSVKIGFAEAGAPSAFARTYPTAAIRTRNPVAALATLMRDACATAAIVPAQVVATVPGFIDRDFDTIVQAANIPELNGRRLASELREALDTDVVLERDVVLQLLGESRAGIAAGQNHVLGVYFGTGIGAAYIEHGMVFRGGGFALELGHVPIHGQGRSLPGILPDRLEAYASGRALEVLAQRHAIDVADIFTRATDSPALSEAISHLIRDQAFAVATCIALFSPTTVVLGGGVVQMKNYPREELARIVSNHLPLPRSVRAMDLRWASLGWKAAIYGALQLPSDRRAGTAYSTGGAY